MKYSESSVDSRIVRAVEENGFDAMTPIQEQAIPVLLDGYDIIGQAQTGTGKTAAFGIPMLQMIDPEDRNVQAIVLCPTRELAIQAASEMRKFSKYMHSIKLVPVYGGQDIAGQIKLIKSGAQIVIGTPGRVLDHIRRHTLKLGNVKMVVLDEADEMLNMGFREDLETILKEIPSEHQTALFSATMPELIMEITDKYLKDDRVLVRVAAKELTVPLVKQYYFQVKSKYKIEAVKRLLTVHNITRSIIFCNTKKMVDDLLGALKSDGFNAEGIHGDLSQHQRDFVMKNFRTGRTEILIATDVAARGIDVDDLMAVINYDIPQDIEFYVHRIGRTGRAGKEGTSYTLVSGKEIYRVRDIERLCHTKMEKGKLPTSAEIIALKSEKIILEAKAYVDKGRMVRVMDVIQYEINKGEVSIEELAAALLKMQLGEESTDVEIEEKFYDRRSVEKYSNGHNRSGYDRNGRNYSSNKNGNMARSKYEKNSNDRRFDSRGDRRHSSDDRAEGKSTSKRYSNGSRENFRDGSRDKNSSRNDKKNGGYGNGYAPDRYQAKKTYRPTRSLSEIRNSNKRKGESN